MRPSLFIPHVGNMTIFSLNNTTAPTSSSSSSNMNLFGSTSGIQQTSSNVPQLFGTTTPSPFGASSSSSSNMNLFGSTSGIQQTSSSVPQLFGTATPSPFGDSSSSSSNMNLFGSTSGIQQTSSSVPQLFGTTIPSPFGASSSSSSNMNLFGSTSGIQQTSSSVPQLFGTMTPSPFGGPLAFKAATNATSGQTQNISPGSSTLPTFEKKYDVNSVVNEPLLWFRDANVSDSSIFGFPRVPSFGVSSNSQIGRQRFDSYSFGQPAVSMSRSQDQICKSGKESTTPLFQSSGFGKSAFGSNQKGSRRSSYIATPEIGSTVPGGANIQSICGMHTYKDKSQEELRFEDYQLGDKGKESTTPLLKISGFGKSAFGINQKGSRTTSYIATPEMDSVGPDGAKIQSICGMQTYKDKSQEELRFEDYQLGDKGQKCGSSFSISGTQGFGVIDNMKPFISPVFNQSTVDQPSYSHFPSTFAVERAGVDSRSSENSIASVSTPFPKSEQSISHIFPPNTSLLNSSGTAASDVSFSPWFHSSPFAPLEPASSSSTTSTFSPLRNPWAALSTPSTLSLTQSSLFPSSVSPSTYPSLAKPSGHDFDQKNSFSPTSVLTAEGAPQSTLCLNCLKQSQPTPPGICNVSSAPLAESQNTPLFFGPLQPEMTPKVGTTLPTTNGSHPSTEGASCSEIGQGVGQQPKYQWTTVNPSPIMPPVETQPSVQISVEHPDLVTSIQYGISSLPVSNSPVPVRQRSSLIIRHSSLSQHRLALPKYKSTSDKPKLPFFMDKENASGVPRTEIIIQRENPRDWVRPTAEFPLGADSSMDRMLDGDKVGDKPKLDPEEMHYDNDKDVDGIMPKLQRADYYTVPPMEELISKEKEEAGFCCHVKDFVVGRHGYGSIKFLGETDVRKLDLDSAVQFNHREVIIYMDESKKPPVGQGLNKPAEITLLNVRCIKKSTGKEYRDGPMVNKYRDILIKKAVEQDAEFVSYEPVEGQWKFRVSHF